MEAMKKHLLMHYMDKEPHGFYQLDGFADVVADDVMHPDSDGDAMMGGATHELMSGCCEVRVLVKAGTSPKVARRLLKKIRRIIKRNGFEWQQTELERQARRHRLLEEADEIPF